MPTVEFLSGNEAASMAMKQINPHVVCAYPITPSTPIVESFASFVANGEVDTEFVTPESEHAAMSACVGAAAAGGRVMTATSSQGLALMHEMLFIAAGMRLPIIAAIASRALSAPLNIHGDHDMIIVSPRVHTYPTLISGSYREGCAQDVTKFKKEHTGFRLDFCIKNFGILK